MPDTNPRQFSISIVSHGHEKYIRLLLNNIKQLDRTDIEVIVTFNLTAEFPELLPHTFPFPLVVIRNNFPKGFACNHNAAFMQATGKNFVILNPDISIFEDPFDSILWTLNRYGDCICAPLIVGPKHNIEDSARLFPSPLSLLRKSYAKILKINLPRETIPDHGDVLNPEWIAGMFMAVPRHIFQKLGGLNERYFLYYEDVDFCARAYLIGIPVYVNKRTSVIHHAQRESHKNFKFFTWHIKSATKFFLSKVYLQILSQKFFFLFK